MDWRAAPGASVASVGGCCGQIVYVGDGHQRGIVVSLDSSLVAIVGFAVAGAGVHVIVVAAAFARPRLVGHASWLGDEIIVISMALLVGVGVAIAVVSGMIGVVVVIAISLFLRDNNGGLLFLVHGVGRATVTTVFFATSLRCQRIQCAATEQ
jgi:ABC-type cobalamin transport system permease subunit